MVPVYNRESAQEDFIFHGENWLLTHLKGQLNTIFDVGSNIGEWTYLARLLHPEAEIHTFEIIPETYRKFLKNIYIDNNIIPNGFGLADRCGTLAVKYRPEYDVVSSYVMDLAMDNSEIRNGLIMSGDAYCDSRRISYIDFLKIDTEGAEGIVLNGFSEMLKQEKIGIILFEYGYVNILTKFLLIDIYKLLEPLGYHIGPLHNGHIEFREYKLFHERFNPSYFVAVHDSKMNLFQ